MPRMRSMALAALVVLVTLAVLLGGNDIGSPDPAPAAAPKAAPKAVPEAVPESAQAAITLAKKKRASCRGITYAKVRGTKPKGVPKRLGRFANRTSVCRGIWQPKPVETVPQGMALEGGTAWLITYSPATNKCRMSQVSLNTGRRLGYVRELTGRVGQRPATYCRHGGGVAIRGTAMWVVESGKVWLLDRTRHGWKVKRAWRVNAPVKASTLIVTDKRVGLAAFEKKGAPRLYWFDIARLKQRRVLDITAKKRNFKQVGPVAVRRIPTFTQGVLADNGRLMFSRSSGRCGELRLPSGRSVAFVPGAQQIELSPSKKVLWASSEAGARPFRAKASGMIPALMSFDYRKLSRGKPGRCHF